MFVLQLLHAHVSNFFVWCSCYASEPKAQHFWILDRGESVWVVPLSWVTFALVILVLSQFLLPQAGAAVSIGTLISSHLILDHGICGDLRLESNPDTGLGNMFARGLWQEWQGFHRLGLHQYTLRWAAWFGPEHQRWQKCEKIIVRLTILLWPSWLSKSETWFYSPLLRCSVQSMWRCACSWRKAVW